MPYVTCPGCGLHTYSAAGWAGVDDCPRCGRDLPTTHESATAVRSFTSQARMAKMESARIALMRLRERASQR
jgi:tRNA(Ile2) C34 agmatinyltransferase TiaS